MEFFSDFHDSAFMRGKASFSVLITLPHSRFLGTVPEALFDPCCYGGFLDSTGLSDFYLHTQLSEFDV